MDRLTFRYFGSTLETHNSANEPLLSELRSRGHTIKYLQWKDGNNTTELLDTIDTKEIILVEDRLPPRNEKHKNQIRIRTLHGIGKFRWNSLPVGPKRFDMMMMPTANWPPIFNRLCSNPTEMYFGIGNGWSKFDIYYKYLQNREKTREYIYNKYNFNKNKKLIIYGPTGIRYGYEHLYQWLWTENSYQRHGSAYFIENIKEVAKEQANFYHISHPCNNRSDEIKDRIPMMVAADMFIGDISSMTHEFSLMDRPIIQIMKEEKDRIAGDFHIWCDPNEETIDFGDIIDIKDLSKTIKIRLEEDSHRDRRNYLKDKYVGICDGNAAFREADAIEKYCKTL